MQYNKLKVTNQSGTLTKDKTQFPSVLAYPQILLLNDVPELKGEFVYLIEKYPLNGLSVVVLRTKVNGDNRVDWKFGDWDGHEINPLNDYWAKRFMSEYSEKILNLMKLIKLEQIQYYFSPINNILTLVDIRLSLNKFSGPGMIKDIFGKLVPTQKEFAKPISLIPDELESLSKKNNIIIKPSTFKTIIRNKALMPMYAIK